MSIYQLIPYDRYITREELARRSGKSDRMIRREINELRKNPETIIISSSHGKGYKRPEGVEEIRLYMYECKSRINDMQETVDILEKSIRAMQTEKDTGQYLLDFAG